MSELVMARAAADEELAAKLGRTIKAIRVRRAKITARQSSEVTL